MTKRSYLALLSVVASLPLAAAESATTNRAPSVYELPCCAAVPGRGATILSPAPEGMRWIPGGEFQMGTDVEQSYVPERPAHRVRVKGFWMDAHEVTNVQFERFVAATGYLTTAERKPRWEELKKQLPPGTPAPDESLLVAGGLVFTPPPRPVPLNNHGLWWRWMPGASWRHPEGPGSDIGARTNHPVVQVSWDDGVAYAKWAGKRLPTEAEWEFAARGGLKGERYAWGGESVQVDGRWMANTFQGRFPSTNSKEDGFERTAPVGSFPVNGYGLHDMIGNCWEWCSDWFRADTYGKRAGAELTVDPRGPGAPHDPTKPYTLPRTTRGGSFLCSDHYCVNYRPSARIGTAYDSGMSHLSFRCVMDVSETFPVPVPVSVPASVPDEGR